MRNPINVTIPFVAPAGTSGSVTLRHDARCGDKAHLAVDVGHQGNGGKVSAQLTLDDMRQLVDGLMDCIDVLERKDRLRHELVQGKSKHLPVTPFAAEAAEVETDPGSYAPDKDLSPSTPERQISRVPNCDLAEKPLGLSTNTQLVGALYDVCLCAEAIGLNCEGHIDGLKELDNAIVNAYAVIWKYRHAPSC